MAANTDIEYYEGDSEQHGNYQYTKLEEVINNYIMSRTTDDNTSSVPRFQIIYQAKRGLRELYYDVVKEIRRVELELSTTLVVILPPDYVSLVKLSWVDDNGHLHPMGIDTTMNIASAHLQDDRYEYLYDDTGNVLIGSGVREKFNDSENPNCFGIEAFRPNMDTSKVFNNGKYNINKEDGVIEFGQDVGGRNIVLEYISDGLFTGSNSKGESGIRVHKFAEEALISYIYYNLIKQSRNIPSYEKQRAKKEFFNMRRIAKKRINAINKEDLMQIFKGQSQWVKRES